jgi:hypothetical protein
LEYVGKPSLWRAFYFRAIHPCQGARNTFSALAHVVE